MKKNLIALAVASAFVVPTMASADVQVYGLAQVEIANISPEDDTATSKSYIDVIDNSNGRVGVKASEDMGNGWSGLAKLEYKIDTADGVAGGTNVGLTPRETMVGLKGKGAGQFQLGRLKSPYKYAGGVKYDPFVATTLQARGNGGMVNGAYGQGGFLSNTIAYWGSFGAVKVALAYGPETNDGMYSFSAKYSASNFEAGVATVSTGDRLAGLAGPDGMGVSVPAGTQTYSATKVFGKYNIGSMHTIVAQYEMTDQDCSGDGCKPNVLFLGYHLMMGKNAFVAEYGQTDADGANGADGKSLDSTLIVVGAIHKMSKTTRIFGGYRSTTSDSTDSASGIGGTKYAGPGDNVISVGLRKDFK
jgi:predicted porin